MPIKDKAGDESYIGYSKLSMIIPMNSHDLDVGNLDVTAEW